MLYLYPAKQQVRAKAYVSSLDEKLNASLRGIQFCQTSKPRTLHVQLSWLSIKTAWLAQKCQSNQHSSKESV